MKSVYLIIPLSIIILSCSHKPPTPAVVAPIPPAPVVHNPFMDSLLADYACTMQNLMDITGIPGAAIAIVKDSTIIFEQGFGLKRIDRTDNVDKHTVFRIGSVSKCYAAILTAILVHEKILRWDDPVIRYLPDFKLQEAAQSDHLTIRNLLSHTTGLPYHTYTTLVEEGMDLDTMILKLQDVKNQPIGQTYSYQNVAFSIIAKVIEAATGKTYEEMLDEKILIPLHMQDASVTYAGIMENDNIAWPHAMRHHQWQRISINKTYYNVAPAGGVNASISDMANLMKALLGNRQDVITSESIKQIFSPVIEASAKNRSYRKVGKIEDSYYGLGWRILHFASDTLIFHGGFVNGYRSEVAIYPKDHLGICILSNAPGEVTNTGIPIFLEHYLAKRDSILAWTERRKLKQKKEYDAKQ